MARILQAELWQEADAVLGEGPAWDDVAQQLSWVDVESSMLHVSTADGRPVAHLGLPAHVGAALPARGGGWLVALPDRLSRLNENGGLSDVVDLEPELAGNRANDAKCDPAGRAWVGTMSYDESWLDGSLYRLGPGPVLTRALTGLGIANGLAWSPDCSTMYFIDTITHQIRSYPFDLDDGHLGQPDVLAEIDEDDGHPDGMCSDDDGCLWVALFAGGCVRRFTPRGDLDAVVQMPVTYTTSCCFGGPGHDQLFVTTARRDLDEAGRKREPLAGSVWVARPGVTGPPATLWRG